MKIPPWAISNTESVRREAAQYRGITPEKKLELVASACRTAALLVDASPNKEKALAHVDPPPPSSVAALERLMRAHRNTRAARSGR